MFFTIFWGQSFFLKPTGEDARRRDLYTPAPETSRERRRE